MLGLLVHCLPQPPNPFCWESKRLCVCWTSAQSYLKSLLLSTLKFEEPTCWDGLGGICGWLSKAMDLVSGPGFQFTVRWLLSTQRGTSSDALLQTKPLGWKGKAPDSQEEFSARVKVRRSLKREGRGGKWMLPNLTDKIVPLLLLSINL